MTCPSRVKIKSIVTSQIREQRLLTKAIHNAKRLPVVAYALISDPTPAHNYEARYPPRARQVFVARVTLMNVTKVQ